MLLVQIVIDLVGCFVIADLARRTVSRAAARFAFLLAALCPFTANYRWLRWPRPQHLLLRGSGLGCRRIHGVGEGRARGQAGGCAEWPLPPEFCCGRTAEYC